MMTDDGDDDDEGDDDDDDGYVRVLGHVWCGCDDDDDRAGAMTGAGDG